MAEFLAIAMSFPTVVLTLGMVLVSVFWLLAIIGVADLEFLELQIDFDIDADAESTGFGTLSGFLMRWGLSGVPVTVVLSLLIVFSWMVCYFGSLFLLPLLPGFWLKLLGGIALLVLCFVVAFPVTAMSLRPLRDIFKGEVAISNADVIGRTCEVRSGEVTEDFGQGLVEDGGAGLLVDIRAAVPNTIARGDKVALVGYDRDNNFYRVMPEAEFMNL